MDITNILNSKAQAQAASAEHQLQQQLAAAAHFDSRTSSEMGSEQSGSHMGDHSSRYPPTHNMHQMGHSGDGNRYHSPTQTPQSMPMLQNSFNPDGYGDGAYIQNGTPLQNESPMQNGSTGKKSKDGSAVKQFACQACGKAFARRSDLARHERIHTGVRPHVCDFEGCGKQFIQRSALTVHARVHTGEKPHMCERCGKPFSDSSSLARHRRIHSGKRPYQCPYANCQKTFTRRTTLTRHQSHHTGTVEEAERAVGEALASRPTPSRHSNGDGYSENGSVNSPSPGAQRLSMSPGSSLPPIPNMHRQGSDYAYMSNGSIPLHVRQDLQQPSPRSSPSVASPSLSSFASNHHRPSMTSHPSAFGPPQPMEPPANNDHRAGSAGGSPHMGSLGWQSPGHQNIPSPGPNDGYSYPEPSYGNVPQSLYYPNSNIRRPQSTEPEAYEPRQRVSGDMWTAQVI